MSIARVVVVGALVTLGTGPSTSPGSLASLGTGEVEAATQRTRTVHVSALDKAGSAVTDLHAAEVEVKLSGKRQEIVSVRPATALLRIALIVSDAGTGAFQQGLARFMRKLLGRAEFALISVIVQAETVVNYSSDAGTLSAGLNRLGVRGRQRGAQLMEAIQDATKEVRREVTRPVIVVVRVGAEAATPLSGDDVREQLRKSGAILYVISTVGAERAAPSQARQGISAEQAQLLHDEDVGGAFNLAQVLGDGSKESGGRHDQVISTTLVPALERVADELLHQYEITYEQADDLKPGAKLAVSTKRKGVTVRAPSRLPN